ncbi:MAG: hypothetical protein RSC73_03000 [Ruthenibacterium sp.]
MKQPCKTQTKRGSMLVTALFLLLFVLIMGTALVTWGMWNVQESVNSRAVSQAYYSAKSLTDMVVNELFNKTEQGLNLDKEIQQLKVGAQLMASYDSQGTTNTLTIGQLPADKATMSIKCTKDIEGNREADGSMKNGIQEITVSTTCAYQKFTRTVTRAMTVEHRPPTQGVKGFTMGCAGETVLIDGTFKNLNILGDVTMSNLKKMDMTNVSIEGDVKIGATHNVNIAGKTYLGGNKNKADIYTEQKKGITLSGNLKFDSNVTMHGEINPSSSTQEKYTRVDYTTPEFQTYELIKPATPTNRPRTIPSIVTESVYPKNSISITPFSGNLTVETSGKDIIIMASKMDVNARGKIACTGGGSVTFYMNGNINLNSFILEREANTQVNFVSETGDITANYDGNVFCDANFLCPKGSLNYFGNVHGTVWCNNLLAQQGQATYTINTVPTKDNWWGDTSKLTTIKSGGGAGGKIEYAKLKYQ